MVWPGVAAFWYLPETVEKGGEGVVFGCWVVEGFIAVTRDAWLVMQGGGEPHRGLKAYVYRCLERTKEDVAKALEIDRRWTEHTPEGAVLYRVSFPRVRFARSLISQRQYTPPQGGEVGFQQD